MKMTCRQRGKRTGVEISSFSSPRQTKPCEPIMPMDAGANQRRCNPIGNASFLSYSLSHGCRRCTELVVVARTIHATPSLLSVTVTFLASLPLPGRRNVLHSLADPQASPPRSPVPPLASHLLPGGPISLRYHATTSWVGVDSAIRKAHNYSSRDGNALLA